MMRWRGRFRNSTESILIATDVAARGLDIPLVDHVIHYQLPRTAEVCLRSFGLLLLFFFLPPTELELGLGQS
jgi:superfamily II DNA helicase RecQ